MTANEAPCPLTARQARTAALMWNSHYYDLKIRDTRLAEEWCVSPCISSETWYAWAISTSLTALYRRLLKQERQARKERRVRRRLQERAEVAS